MGEPEGATVSNFPLHELREEGLGRHDRRYPDVEATAANVVEVHHDLEGV